MALSERELRKILDRSIQDITGRYAGIRLREGDRELSKDICTVHTVLEGERRRAALLLRADTALLARLTRHIVGKEAVTGQDIQDAATEYFNILCGHVAAGLFQWEHVSHRFRPPRFHPGCYRPGERGKDPCVLRYAGEDGGGVQLVYMGLEPGKK